MAQAAIELGFDVELLSTQQKRVLQLLIEVYDATKRLDGIKIAPINISGFADLQKVVTEQNKILTQVNESLSKYTTSVSSASNAQKQSSASFTQNTKEVEANATAQKDLKQQLDAIYTTRKKLEDFKANTNFKNNAQAEADIARELVSLDEKELAIKKQIAAYNKDLGGQDRSGSTPAGGQDFGAGAKEKALEKEQVRQLNAELKTQAQLELANAGSIAEAKAAVSALRQERDKLNLTTAEGVVRQTDLNKKIDEYNAFIKINADRQQAQTLNVGNYPQLTKQLEDLTSRYNKLTDAEKETSAAAGLLGEISKIKSALGDLPKQISNASQAFNILNTELLEIRQKLSGLKATDPGFDKLAKDEAILTRLTESLDKTFTNSRQEMLALRNAAQTLGKEFGQTSEQFLQFIQVSGERANEIQDIQKTLQFQSSDTKYIDGILNGINGLVSAYGAAQAAQQLFGDGTQQSAEQMQRLQAILTLVVSVQQVMNTLQTESGTVQTVLAGKTALLNAAERLNALLTGQAATARKAEALTAEELVAAQEAEVIALAAKNVEEKAAAILSIQAAGLSEAEALATYEQAAATDTATVALEREKEAAIASAAATKTFVTALTATGIVVAILAIAAAFVVSTRNAKLFSGEAANAQKRLKDYGDTAESIADGVLVKLDDQLKSLNKELGEKMPTAIDDAKDALIILDQRLKKLQDYKKPSSYFTQAFNIDAYKQAYNELFSFLGFTENNITENLQRESDLRIKIAKIEAAERIKAFQEELEAAQNAQISISNTFADLQQDADERTAQNEKKSLSERIVALKDSLEQRRKIIQNNLNLELSNTTDPRARNALQEKANAESIKAERDYYDKLSDLQQQASDKSFQQLQESINAQIEALKHIAENDDLTNYASFKERFSATGQIAKLQKDLSDATLKHDTENGKARVTAEIEASNRLIEIAKQTRDTIQGITLDRSKFGDIIPIPKPEDIQKQVQPIIDSFKFINDALLQNLSDTADKGANLFTIAFEQEQFELAEQYNSGKISREGFEKGLTDLTKKYSKESLKFAIDEAQARLKLLDKESDAYKKLSISIAEALAIYNKPIENEGLKKLEGDLERIAEITANLTSAFTTLANIGFDNQKADLEEIGAQEEKNYEQQQNNIQNSIASDQDRANQLKILDSAHAARQEEIARKQREVDNKKAEFDKAASILKIITGTAAAVVQALPNVPLAIAVGILGAAELAAAIATKVPHYAKGTKSHKGGAAVVGEEYKPELVQHGNESYIIDRPTYIPNLPIAAKVTPLSESIISMANKAALRGIVVNMFGEEKRQEGISQDTKAILKGLRELKQKPIKAGYTYQDTLFIAKNIYHTA